MLPLAGRTAHQRHDLPSPPTPRLRQHYFPKQTPDQVRWLTSFAGNIPAIGSELELPAEDVARAAQDAAFCAYVNGSWLNAARNFGPTATLAARRLRDETGDAPVELPVFTPPPLPEGVEPVPPGALLRVFAFVQAIKAAPGYTPAHGELLNIIGPEDATERPHAAFTLRTERGADGETVRIRFFRYGRPGVFIQGRRGDGEWEDLAIALKSPWTDKRPLLVPGQPEVREYRMCFYAGSAPVGDYTPVAQITVTP